MKAKLFLKGNREPQEIPLDIARDLELMIVGNKPDNTPVSIPDVFTGVKGDLKYVVYEKEPNYEPAYRLQFTDKEALEFQETIKEFLVDGKLKMEGEMDLLASKGYINITKKNPKGENKTITDFNLRVVSPNIVDCVAYTLKLDAWKDYVGRKEFIEKKELEALQKIADQV